MIELEHLLSESNFAEAEINFDLDVIFVPCKRISKLSPQKSKYEFYH